MAEDVGARLLKGIQEASGFDSFSEYLQVGFGFPLKSKKAAWTFPRLLGERFFKTKTAEEMIAGEAKGSKRELKKTLGAFQLTCLGIGFMLGAGIFVSPGYIANSLTGPALVIAYLVASLSAFLSSFCYAEFTVDIPIAGAAYNYIYVSLGEGIAWIVVSNLILEYILANAAVVRGFSPYLARLFNKDSTFFLYTWHGYTVDWWGFGITLVCTSLLSLGMHESALVNAVITVIHVLLMIFIIIAGFVKGKAANFRPFTPFNWRNIFNGAAVAFFSFIGFDALATTAEEQLNPQHDMPISILGAVGTVTIIYALMSVVLCLMVPYASIDPNAAFAAAFDYVGLSWAKYIVSLGALLGIFTGTLIGVLGAARILVGCCRERMLPPFMAWVGARRQTPWIATWVIGITTAVIALLTDFAELANMVSIGTFVVFWFVAVALIWRRSYVPGVTTIRKTLVLLLNLAAVIGFSLGFTLVWVLPAYQPSINVEDYASDYPATPDPPLGFPAAPKSPDAPPGPAPIPAGSCYDQQPWWLIALGCCTLVSIFVMWLTVEQAYVPSKYKVPLYPLVPCASIFLNTFLLGQLDQKSYQRFGWWTLAVALIYILYGMIASQAKDDKQGQLPSVYKSPLDRSHGSSSSDTNSLPSGKVPQLQMATATGVVDDADISTAADGTKPIHAAGGKIAVMAVDEGLVADKGQASR